MTITREDLRLLELLICRYGDAQFYEGAAGHENPTAKEAAKIADSRRDALYGFVDELRWKMEA